MTEFLYNAIQKYIEPLINFSSTFIDVDGKIKPIDHKDSVYKFENKKYKNDNSLPQFIIPTVAKNDSEYLHIKSNPNLEIFNPFVNLKHMNLVALLVKSELENYYNNDDSLVTDKDYEDSDFSESYQRNNETISFFSVNESDGQISLVFSDNSDPSNTIEIVKVTGIEQIYLTWLLCIKAMETCIKHIPKEFQDPQKSWAHISTIISEWEKSRKKIAKIVQDSKEIDNIFEDLTSDDISNLDINDFVDEEDMIDFMFERYGKFKDNDSINFNEYEGLNSSRSNYYEEIDFS